jgi:hypothetical protein
MLVKFYFILNNFSNHDKNIIGDNYGNEIQGYEYN